MVAGVGNLTLRYLGYEPSDLILVHPAFKMVAELGFAPRLILAQNQSDYCCRLRRLKWLPNLVTHQALWIQSPMCYFNTLRECKSI
jgi:hypothetical protein